MSHNIEHFTYPKDVNKQKVQKDIDNYVAHADWQEGCSGLAKPIRWLDGKIYETYDDAEEAIRSMDSGWYDQIAVLYYEREYKSDEKSKELSKIADEARKEYERRDNVLYADMVTSAFIGCKKCGSKLARTYLRTNFCPVCKNNLRPDHMMKSIEAAKSKWNRANANAAERIRKNAKKSIKWLVKIEYHT